MRSFFDWHSASCSANESWLILGKGPSFSKLDELDTSSYRTFALNDVVIERPVSVAHAIDIDVIDRCGHALLRNAGVLVMPWIPHIRTELGVFSKRAFFGVGTDTLDDYCSMVPILSRLRDEDRLLWYNLYTAAPQRLRPGSPVVHATEFSASAALNLLTLAGVRKVRSLGVDGGSGYSDAFKHQERTTMLQTGQASYDSQFRGLAETIMRTGVDFSPLDVDSPIKVFVGTQPEQMLAFKVLEYSIRRHCSMAVDIVPLFQAVHDAQIEIPTVRNPLLRPKTPFSFQRFAIPQLKGHAGRAIYLDSDMQVFSDLKALWTWGFGENDLLTVQEPRNTGRRPQFSVMVLDCARLAWDVREIVRQLEQGRWTYEQLMFEMAPASSVGAVLPSTWNDLERHTAGTALTHYTDMDAQPWLTTHNLLGELWCAELFSAIRENFIDIAFVEDHVQRGWVRPSLLYQLKHDITDPLMLPWHIRRADRTSFVPPHLRGIRKASRAPTVSLFDLAFSVYAHARFCARAMESHARKAKRTVFRRNSAP